HADDSRRRTADAAGCSHGHAPHDHRRRAGAGTLVIVKTSAFAPFRVRSYRFQWPADLATSWAFEMESLILGWYVLVETRSVLLLTVFASLQYLGTLVAPLFGLMGDRLGHRNVLCAMRITYTVLASTLTVLVFTGFLTPARVFIIAALFGLVRSSDQV